MSRQIVVIGGGAAGFFGAIHAAGANPGDEVVLLEKLSKVLTKVRISGGGRCNVTHNCMEPRELVNFYPRGNRELLGPFNRFGPVQMLEWLKERGVKVKAEADGRMFPVTDNSETIARCLEDAADEGGVEVCLRHGVEGVEVKEGGGFDIYLKGGEVLEADALLLATGGGKSNVGVEIARKLGHKIVEAVPSLFTFNIEDERLAGMAGVSFKEVEVSVVGQKGLKTRGPFLITHWGVSGPAVLKLSAWGARELNELWYEFEVKLNFLPSMGVEGVLDELKATRGSIGNKEVDKNPMFEVPRRFWEKLVEAADIEVGTKWRQLNDKQLRALVGQLCEGVYCARGKSTNKDEFVTAGGVDLKEVNFKTMESKRVPGLYFAGEVLNIDGVTGGFNFQAAWTTSWIAGRSM